MSEVDPCTTLLVRCDSTTHMGTGHIMRCIALAQAWQDRGGSVTFLSYCDSNDLRQRILDEGFKFISTEKLHPDPSDLKRTLSILTNKTNMTNNSGQANNSWLILDGYHFDTAYQKAIRNAGYHSVVIDDMNHQPHYHADILLNQNINAPKLKYSCDEDTILLLGCKYALLRREFLRYRNWQREVPAKATKILVTLGGADPDNVTLKVIRGLNRIDDPDLDIKIVVGPSNYNMETLQREIHKMRNGERITQMAGRRVQGRKHNGSCAMQLLKSADMPVLMAWADMAVSAAGSTCWELLFMRVPFLVAILAENQNDIAVELGRIGIAENLGWFHEIDELDLEHCIGKMIADKERRVSCARLAQQTVDGSGSQKIMDLMF